MSASNSISHLLEQFLELNTNSLETFERINEAISTDKETVTIDLFDNRTGKMTAIQIPAFGFLKREIERIDKNLTAISGLDTSSANVKLKDGSYRKIHTSKLKGPSLPVTSLATPKEFSTKLNDFFEDFLNPLLTISLDVKGQIPVDTERIYTERFIFDHEDIASTESFDEIYKGQNDLNYESFISKIEEAGLKYRIDAETVDMPIRSIQYTGGLDVLKVENVQKTVIVDNVSQTKTIKVYTLNKLTYSDANKRMKDTESLKIGDSLVVNNKEYNTRYKITSIDASTSQVGLELLEGYVPVKIGADSLRIYKDIDLSVDIEIKVGFNERQVVFVKPIDPISKIPSTDFSPGIAFFSNELTIQSEEGEITSLAKYYKEEVADFGQFIKALKVDYIPPASEGLIPDAPIIESDNFKVTQINKHLTENSSVQKVKQIKSDKVAAKEAVKKLDSTIKKKRKLIATKKFSSKIERNREKNELSSLIREKAAETKVFSSSVSEIKAIAESNELPKASPKYRVRGFWSIPDAKKVGDEVSQEVVQFIARYRYASATGKTSVIEQIKFNKKTAAFSNWVEVKGPVRKREKQADGGYRWIIESEEDAQAINFNSIDLPIRQGEVIEMMVKSVSEAGFPTTPVESEWSEIISIPFPEGVISTDGANSLVNQNDLDNVKVEINDDLESQNLFTHLDTGFTAGDTYYAHGAESLASGFLTGEQNPISVYEKLLELQNQLERLQSKVEGTVGELQIKIVDEEGVTTMVKNNTTAKIFAGYYVDNAPTGISKGYVVTKNFTVELHNTKASDLELCARIVGDLKQPAYVSTSEQEYGLGIIDLETGNIKTASNAAPDNMISNDTYYMTEGKYDQVPLVYQNLTGDGNSYNYFATAPEQSSQLNGQFIYSRFKNISNNDNLYLTTDADTGSSYSVTNGVTTAEYGLSYPIRNNNGGSTLFTPDAITNRGHLRDFSQADSTTMTCRLTAAPSSNGSDFIWNGTYGGGNVESSTSNSEIDLIPITILGSSEYDKGLFLSKFHPLIKDAAEGGTDPDNRLNAFEMVTTGIVSMPKYAVKRANDKNGKIQTPYQPLAITFRDGSESGPLDESGTVIPRKSVKNSFTEDDQYLLGGLSCGSFLYLSPINQTSLSVDGPNKYGKKLIEGGSQNAVSVDMVFQYRMTDYFGEDESGKGRIGGIYGNSFANLTYSKKIGLDILDTYKSEFKFDIEVYAKYRAVGTNKNSINKVMLQSYRSSGTGSSGGWWWNRRRFFNSSSGYTDFSSSRLYDFDARPYR
jgi:hypothetical protein